MSGKVTYQYDEIEDKYEIDLINNRHKLAYALDELKQLRRNIYKGYSNNYIIVSEDQVVIRDGEKVKEEYNFEDAKTYLHDQDIIDQIDQILDIVNNIIE